MSEFDKKLEKDFQKALAAAMSPKKSAARRAYLTARRKENDVARKYWQDVGGMDIDEQDATITQNYLDAVKQRQRKQAMLGLPSTDILSHLEKRRKNSR